MAYYVLRVRQVSGETVCAVQADEVRLGDSSATFWLDGALVYQAPRAALQQQQQVADRPAAEALIRQWSRRGGRRGTLGPEQAAIRPAAGGQRQIGGVVEQVIAVVEGSTARPRP